MSPEAKRERTFRLLQSSLEALARLSERSETPDLRLDGALLAVDAATRNAVALELLTHEEAGEIWASVARRHPGVAWCRRALRPAA